MFAETLATWGQIRPVAGHVRLMSRLEVFDSDVGAFEEFFRECSNDVWRYVRRRVLNAEDADDITAEVFTTAWRRRKTMPSNEKSRLWLFGVARKTLSNHRRSVRRQDRLRLRMLTSMPNSNDEFEGAATPGRNPEVPLALAALNDDDRDLLIMRAWDGLAVNEIAELLDITANAASQRLAKARRRLSKHLDELSDTKKSQVQHTETRPAGHKPGEPSIVDSLPGEYPGRHITEADRER